MARTTLMSWFQRLEKDYLEAELRGVPVGAVQAARHGGVSRRDFIGSVGAGVVGLSLIGPGAVARAAGPIGSPRIGIIGGGISGLTAALTLQDAGYASSVFESSDRLGGRMHSDMSGYWADGQSSEWCGELIDTGHHLILQMAQRFKLVVKDEVQAQPNGSEDTYYVHGQYYTYAQATKDFQPVHNAIQSQIQDAPFPTTYNNYTPFGRMLDNTSLYQWIERYVPGGHASNLGALLDGAYTNEYGLDTAVQSSLNLLYLLRYQPSPGQFSIYGASDERYHIQGGNQQLPLAVANRLRSGPPTCTIKTQWKMTTIATNSDSSITCTFSTPGGTVQQTFDRVILAIPFSVLRGLTYRNAGFDALKQTAITQLGYGTNTKLNLQFSSRYWNTTGPWPGVSDGNIYTDLSFQNAWDASRAQAGNSGLLVLFMGGSNGASVQTTAPYTTSTDRTSAAIIAKFLKQLDLVWPGEANQYTGLGSVSTPWTDPNLLGSYSCWKVGQYTAFSGYEGQRQAKIHFGGEQCSLSFQGFMEGGAQEGQRAANEILGDYKAGTFP